MKNVTLKKAGVRIPKNQKAIEALQESVPHWIHHYVEDESYMGGKRYLSICDCSECGYTVNMEHDVCPNCKAKMNLLK